MKESKDEHKELLRKISKVKMSAKSPGKGLKSNVEIGRDLDLYIINEVVGHGLPLFTPKGATIKREIERFAIDEELKRGYLHTSTPIMASSDLYKISGHWDHYQDKMFVMEMGKKKYALRPMTCPFHFILYKSKPRSYKDLPIKYAEMSSLFRNEQSGELRGLTRVRQMTLADAHIICTPEQVEEEFAKVMKFLEYIMKTLGIEEDIWFRFSKWDPKSKGKYIQDEEAWESSQNMMKKILDKLKVKYEEADNEAAFYGPKLDLQYKDVYEKEDTLLTIQIDFALPERYDMTYKDKDNKLKRPMVIHRSSTGTSERMIAFLLEKYQGSLPTWLSPIQVKVLPMSDKNVAKSNEILESLRQNGVRAEVDSSNDPISKKVRDSQLEKINYTITIGDKEESSNTLAVRSRDGKVNFGVKIEDFIKDLREEISERK